jgi:HK97 gp10 family phage protein
MTKPTMTVEGDERLAATARKAADDLDDMTTTNRGVAETVRARAASGAPKVTGALAGSVVVSAVGKLDIEIAATAEYANVVEYGHQGVPAKPFMANALRDSQALIVGAYERDVADTVDNVKGA